MSRRAVFSSKAPKPVGPYSQAIVAGGFVFVSGQIPVDPSTGELIDDIEKATELVLENTRRILEEAGSSLDKVVKVTVYLRDLSDFQLFNEVYSRYFPEAPPARSTLQAKLPKDARLMLDAIAIAGG
ncbi:MAG: hypothetical protein DRN99_08240 [Thermoproteota archaeon]|nr:MAG: hypothetical protein DRN99_08240 [Candidatus Korarchaeota archaeon]